MGADFAIRTYRSANDFLVACAPALVATRSISANFALTTTYALEEHRNEQGMSGSGDDFWISAILCCDDCPHDARPLFALAIIGNHAGRLASSVDLKGLPPARVSDAMHQLFLAAREANVAGTRIFGIMGPKALCEPFADAWGSAYGLRPKLIMDFALTHVTRTTLRPSTLSLASNVTLGLCSPADLGVAAAMSERATHPMDEPVPPPLDAAAAYVHAKKLIDGRHLYGARVDGVLRSIVSITRETPGVRAVSKAYTDPLVRGLGLAEALVRYALQRVFEDGTVHSVCLFFEPSNPSAVRLYSKIGFTITAGENEDWAEVAWETH
ncbi:uncharacterized protein C8Q71DRAFT_412599 [Rhodofomes roseus]|uniref:N-acetyltransferase domain-containing protein n=1 Tax=Rhodofomes roseus TaxID=34475 RepID=A0ABQ8KRV3_9APHY|nr:uncharacterized protein C8Q71DRAFT_412599 [Rhodofomes roseus]KAH9840551.1 hypothetical protein C8Q71DRAFT_412599 [Rhodofomes roseus]